MPPRINQQAIINWQNWLNTNYPPAAWIPLNEFTALIVSIPGANNTATYNTNSGYPLKSFLNTQTGEIRNFDARKFYA